MICYPARANRFWPKFASHSLLLYCLRCVGITDHRAIWVCRCVWSSTYDPLMLCRQWLRGERTVYASHLGECNWLVIATCEHVYLLLYLFKTGYLPFLIVSYFGLNSGIMSLLKASAATVLLHLTCKKLLSVAQNHCHHRWNRLSLCPCVCEIGCVPLDVPDRNKQNHLSFVLIWAWHDQSLNFDVRSLIPYLVNTIPNTQIVCYIDILGRGVHFNFRFRFCREFLGVDYYWQSEFQTLNLLRREWPCGMTPPCVFCKSLTFVGHCYMENIKISLAFNITLYP